MNRLQRMANVVLQAQRRHRDSVLLFHSAVEKFEGERVSWKRGKYPQYGKITMIGYGLRLQVENEKTGKRIWLSFGDINWGEIAKYGEA